MVTAHKGLGIISLKLLGDNLAPKLGYFILEKELLNFSEMSPRFAIIEVSCSLIITIRKLFKCLYM